MPIYLNHRLLAVDAASVDFVQCVILSTKVHAWGERSALESYHARLKRVIRAQRDGRYQALLLNCFGGVCELLSALLRLKPESVMPMQVSYVERFGDSREPTSTEVTNWLLDYLQLEHLQLTERQDSAYLSLNRYYQLFTHDNARGLYNWLYPRLKAALQLEAETIMVPLFAYRLMALTVSDEELADVEKAKSLLATRVKSLIHSGNTESKAPYSKLCESIYLPKGPIKRLKAWQAMVQQQGERGFIYFSRADEIEKYWQSRCTTRLVSFQSAKQAWAWKHYQAEMEQEQQWAILCEMHGVDVSRYQRGKRLLPLLETARDDFPDVFIKGEDYAQAFDNYAIVKLSKSDMHLLLLGELTDCCFSVGRNGERCINDLLNQSDKSVYVLLKRKRKTKAFLDDSGKINYRECRIVGFTYVWRSVCGNVCFDSVESMKQVDKTCSAHLFQELASNLASKTQCKRVTKGLKQAKEATCPPELMASGIPYIDSHRQVEIYPPEDRVSMEVALALDRRQVKEVLIPAKGFTFKSSYQAFLRNIPKALILKPIYGLVQCYLALAEKPNEKQCLSFLKHMAPLEQLNLIETEKASVAAVVPSYLTLEQVMSLDVKNLAYLSTAIAAIFFHAPTWELRGIDLASLSNRLLKSMRMKLLIAGTDEMLRYLQYALTFIVFHYSCREPSLVESDYLAKLEQVLPVFIRSSQQCAWMASQDNKIRDNALAVIALLIVHYTPTTPIEEILTMGFSLSVHQLESIGWMITNEVSWVDEVNASGEQLFPLTWMVEHPVIFGLLGSKDNIHDGLRYFLTESCGLTRDDLGSIGDLTSFTYMLTEYQLFKQFNLSPRQYLSLSQDERVNLLFPSKRSLLESYIAATNGRYSLLHYSKLICSSGVGLLATLSFDFLASLTEKQVDFVTQLDEAEELEPLLAIRQHTPLKEYLDKLCALQGNQSQRLARARAIESGAKISQISATKAAQLGVVPAKETLQEEPDKAVSLVVFF